MADSSSCRFVLRDLPLPPRIVLGTFLIAVGLSYFTGLVQLHYQHAPPGKLLPTPQDAVNIYHGPEVPMSRIEKLLSTTEGPFNGTGTMVPALFEKSDRRWNEKLEKMSAEERERLLKEREGERQALLQWVRLDDAARKRAYDDDQMVLDQPLVITQDYMTETDDGRAAVMIQSLFIDRCVRCHMPSGADKHAQEYPMEEWSQLEKYLVVENTAMELPKLAQTTHVHALGFSMLFGLTGLIFSLTSYPKVIRVIFSPFPLVVQMIDISCWWLGRLDPLFAQVIVVTGGLVGLGLAIHIFGSFFHLFAPRGSQST